jgi:hypothetical protein
MKKQSDTRTDLWLKFGLACGTLKEDLQLMLKNEIVPRDLPTVIDTSIMSDVEFRELVDHITGERGTWNLRR